MSYESIRYAAISASSTDNTVIAAGWTQTADDATMIAFAIAEKA